MSTDNGDEALGDLLDELSNVDDQSDEAELNATTITDNNGDRIELVPNTPIRLVPSTKKDLNRDDVIRVVKRHEEKIILIKRKPTS